LKHNLIFSDAFVCKQHRGSLLMSADSITVIGIVSRTLNQMKLKWLEKKAFNWLITHQPSMD